MVGKSAISYGGLPKARNPSEPIDSRFSSSRQARHNCHRSFTSSRIGLSLKTVYVSLQISTWLPSSTTRLVGSLKKSIAVAEFRSIHAKIFSRQIGMPGLSDGNSV